MIASFDAPADEGVFRRQLEGLESAASYGGADAVRDCSLRLRDSAVQAKDGTVLYIKDEPLKSTLIAAAGASLMALVGLLSRFRERTEGIPASRAARRDAPRVPLDRDAAPAAGRSCRGLRSAGRRPHSACRAQIEIEPLLWGVEEWQCRQRRAGLTLGNLTLPSQRLAQCGLQLVERIDAPEHAGLPWRRGAVGLPGPRFAHCRARPGLDRTEQGVSIVERNFRHGRRSCRRRSRSFVPKNLLRKLTLDVLELLRPNAQGRDLAAGGLT